MTKTDMLFTDVVTILPKRRVVGKQSYMEVETREAHNDNDEAGSVPKKQKKKHTLTSVEAPQDEYTSEKKEKTKTSDGDDVDSKSELDKLVDGARHLCIEAETTDGTWIKTIIEKRPKCASSPWVVAVRVKTGKSRMLLSVTASQAKDMDIKQVVICVNRFTAEFAGYDLAKMDDTQLQEWKNENLDFSRT